MNNQFNINIYSEDAINNLLSVETWSMFTIHNYYIYTLYKYTMEYAELKLYNRQGGDAFTKKNIIDNTKEDENK